jgi:mannose-6-phosphate isomerase-like protein (cupin superfamily)
MASFQRRGEEDVIVKNEDNFLVHVSDVSPAPVTADRGWRKMDIRFILRDDLSGHSSVCFFRTLFEPGAAHEIHTHPGADEFLYVVRGRCMVGAGDDEFEAGPGSLQFIPKGKKHWLRNVDSFELVEIVGGYAGVGSLQDAGYDFIAHLADRK